jgi:hypothetical protein
VQALTLSSTSIVGSSHGNRGGVADDSDEATRAEDNEVAVVANTETKSAMADASQSKSPARWSIKLKVPRGMVQPRAASS